MDRKIKKQPVNFIAYIKIFTAAALVAVAGFYCWPAAAGGGFVRSLESIEESAQKRNFVLSWKHGTTKSAALESLKGELQRLGYAKYVRWDGYEAKSRVTRMFFRIIDSRGRVTDDAVVIERCRGMAGGEVLKQCRATLQRLFPGGGTM